MELDLEPIRARAEAATAGPWASLDFMLFIDNGYGVTFASHTPDAEFIAHARTDVPALIAEVERLTKELTRQEQMYADLQHHFEVHFKRSEDLDAPCHACHQLEAEEYGKELDEALDEVERLRSEADKWKEALDAAEYTIQHERMSTRHC